MTNPIGAALKLLAHFWLEEVRLPDLPTIAALPELDKTLPHPDEAALTKLAIEYQRLFGFNLPPYESVFVDPSAMLLAPATARTQALYRQTSWTPPVGVRVGAPDHLGLELLALAEIQAQAPRLAQDEAEAETKEQLERLAQQLQIQHLALWVPAFILTLRRLAPHPFYATLADLTLDLLLATLPPNSPFIIHHSPFTIDPFPVLPPPPVYDPEGRLIPSEERTPEAGLRAMVRRLLTPCKAGLFLTREDIARMGRALDLPGVTGDRAHMLETLFRLAGEYDLVPDLLDQLKQLFADVAIAYQGWVEEYPAWTPYAQAWLRRVTATQVTLNASEETM
ncbi:MAG: molecular chaperone TorD family protein [Chloroflexi bacterium]|nr:molecular chaperone TorD family protein [Chloroflexota bacterium]